MQSLSLSLSLMPPFRLYGAGLVAMLIFILAGCATGGYQRAAATSESLHAAARETEAAQQQINTSLATLEQLVQGPNDDLRLVYSEYRRSVSDLEGSVRTLERRAKDADQQKQLYLQTWDARMAEIRNPEIHELSRERQREVVDSFDEVQVSYTKTLVRLIPLMQDLRDLQRMLGVDLTSAGVEVANDLLPQVRDRANELADSLSQLAEDFRDAATRLDADNSIDTERARR